MQRICRSYKIGQTTEGGRRNMTAAEQFISQLEMAESFVERAYLGNLRNLPTVEQDEYSLNPEHIRLFQLDRIVYDAEENIEQ